MDGTNLANLRSLAGGVLALIASFVCAAAALGAPNITNTTQKGSLLIFPDVIVRDATTTIIGLSNDGTAAVDVKCTWLDGNKNRTHFVLTLTKNQAVWFDAASGEGTVRVNPFPSVASGGFDNPHLPGGIGPYWAGMLVCLAVNPDSSSQVKWNHLYGTATVLDAPAGWAYEYTAWAFFAPTGTDFSPIGTAGILNLNGAEYDACPQYLIGALSPAGTRLHDELSIIGNRVALASCNIQLTDDWRPSYTKLQFDVWNSDEVKFTGAFACADGWHETIFTDFVAASLNFDPSTLHTDTARYRVQAVKSLQCEGSQAAGLLGIHSTYVGFGRDQLNGLAAVGTNLTAAGKLAGKVTWDPDMAVAEGTVR